MSFFQASCTNGEAVLQIAEGLGAAAECLKDIQRFLREDDPTKRPAFFELHQMDLARSDLVPLLHKYSDEEDVVTNVGKRALQISPAQSMASCASLIGLACFAVKVATFLSLPASADSDAIHKQVWCML